MGSLDCSWLLTGSAKPRASFSAGVAPNPRLPPALQRLQPTKWQPEAKGLSDVTCAPTLSEWSRERTSCCPREGNVARPCSSGRPPELLSLRNAHTPRNLCTAGRTNSGTLFLKFPEWELSTLPKCFPCSAQQLVRFSASVAGLPFRRPRRPTALGPGIPYCRAQVQRPRAPARPDLGSPLSRDLAARAPSPRRPVCSPPPPASSHVPLRPASPWSRSAHR